MTSPPPDWNPEVGWALVALSVSEGLIALFLSHSHVAHYALITGLVALWYDSIRQTLFRQSDLLWTL